MSDTRIEASDVWDVNRNQHEINNSYHSLLNTSAVSFEDYTNAVDCSKIIEEYANSLESGSTLYIPNGQWAIKNSCIIKKPINIVSDGILVVDGQSEAVLRFENKADYEFEASDCLSKLPEKGDTKLFLNENTISILGDVSNYFFTILSTEVEIIRIGYSDPYYKNETLEFIDSKLTIRGQVDLTYTDFEKCKILFYKKSVPTNIQLKLSMEPTVGQSTGARILESEGCSFVTWNLYIDRNSSKTISGTSFKYSHCIHFKFEPGCRIDGGQSDNGDSYGFLNNISSYILHEGVTYFDSGNTTKFERGYAGRHGKYVYFNECFLNGIDDHYGHHYFISNMIFTNRGISIAGGDVTIENCIQNGSAYLMQQRLDTPYNDGRLIMVNCHAKSGLLIAESANDINYNSKYKSWDEIYIKQCSSESSNANTHAIRFSVLFGQNDNFRTDKLYISGFKFKRVGNSTGKLINSGGGAKFNKIFLSNVDIDLQSNENQLFGNLYATEKIDILNTSYLDGEWVAPIINIDQKTTIGYSLQSSITLFASNRLVITDCDITDKCSAYYSASNQGEIYLNFNRISGRKFFDNSNLRNKVVSGVGNTVLVDSISFDGDLRNFQRVKYLRYKEEIINLATINIGEATQIKEINIMGARIGDVVDATFKTNNKGLKINAWVSGNDTVQYYIENPASNPNGQLTFSSIGLIFYCRSN